MIVVHTVGGGHVDALIAAPLAAAMAIAVTRPRAIVITVLLTVACLVKAVIVAPLALWLWWLVHADWHRRGRILVTHLAMVAGLMLASVVPFLSGWHTFAPFVSLGGVEAWASPSHLVGRAAQAIVGSLDAARVVEAAFGLVFVAGLWRLARRRRVSEPAALAADWGVALLLLALSMPYLLPWYAAWFTPFLGLVADMALLFAGALVTGWTWLTGVLALTLIPADPFHGLTTPGVMYGVHYAAASVLLVVFLVVALKVFGPFTEHKDRSTTLRSAPLQRPLPRRFAPAHRARRVR